MNINTNLLRILSWMAIVAFFSVSQFGIAHAATIVPSNMPLSNIDRALSNVMLDLSVEFPTGDQNSYNPTNTPYATATSNATTFYGYFDPFKCYKYDGANLYFYPVVAATAGHAFVAASAGPPAVAAVPYQAAVCSAGDFSGNFMNWASMANLDQFRQILTGGNRVTDTTTLTVLQRAANDSQSNTGSYYLNRTATNADAGTAAQTSYRSANLREKMLVQPGGSVTVTGLSTAQMSTQDCATLKATYKAANGNANPSWDCYHVNVKVCDSTIGIESNCVKYGSNYKPEGLMQKYEQNMRFAAFGYLNDGAKSRQGGVLRARMKSIGPTMADPINISIVNPNLEWDKTTGVYTANPDITDQAATSGATKSGVLNYLNKFGYGSGYKGYDPMAELYYESLRYLRKMAPTTASLATYTNAMVDDFPVINFDPAGGSYSDPVTSSCQQNFIVAIGDVNNHCDTRVPNGVQQSGNNCSGSDPTDDPSSPATAVNFATWTNNLKTIQGGSIGSTDYPGRYAGWYMGGMAYWAHVNDIRPDRAAQRPTGKIQNVTTFMVDVLEPFNGGSLLAAQQAGTMVTPFFTAAKFGGFDLTLTNAATPNNPDTFKAGSTVKSWDKNGNGTPDNWYAGNDPITMQSGLTNVFQSIVTATNLGDGAAPATSGVSIATANKIYYASYSMANGGIGSIKACAFTATINACDLNPDWDAAVWLNPLLSKPFLTTSYATYQDNTTRQIITRSNGVGKAFTYGNLTTAEKALMDIDPSTKATDTPTLLGSKRVDFLRGDATYEITKTNSSGIFRTRASSKLGDIVGSGTVYVGAPNALYSGPKFKDYATYITTYASRPAVNYVGANDGMLHAFDAASGKELFAYVPNYFLTADTSTTSAKINSLTMPTYQHQFYVDATPMVGDVDTSLDGSNWKTMLVGGYGAGGKGFYALDITKPATYFTTAMNAESNASSISMWEISNADADYSDMGYTYNQPSLSPASGQALQFALIPTAAGGNQWAIIVGNGFGSASGKAVLYFINPSDGTQLGKVEVDGGPDNGLATPFPVSAAGNGVIDTIWAGDLKGNMWRVRWDTGSMTWTSSAAFTGASTKPITSAPAATAHPSVAGAWSVVFGTGKYIERSDYNTTTQQSLYGIVDSFSGTPITVADLVQQTVGTPTAADSSGDFTRTMSSNAVDFATKKGWYFDMPTTNGERSIVNPVIPADTGVALMSSFTPASACLSATGYVNVLNAFTGGKVVDTTSGSSVDVPSWGGVGMGIPYFSSVVSSAGKAIVKAGGVRLGSSVTCPTCDSKSEIDLNKSYVRGSRFSWRQIR